MVLTTMILTLLRGLKVEVGHNGVIHTLDRGPNLVAKGQIGIGSFLKSQIGLIFLFFSRSGQKMSKS